MKHFIISYMYGIGQLGTGTAGVTIPIYPNRQQLTTDINEPNVTILSIIEVSEEEYNEFFKEE